MAHNTDNREIEVRFLEIDADKLKSRLNELGAQDYGEQVPQEIIFYDAAGRWPSERKRVRLRQTKAGISLTYKHFEEFSPTGTREIEFVVSNWESAKNFLEAVGLIAKRQQEKKRHTFILDGVTVDIDTWPGVPTYVELEGESEDALKRAASELGLGWDKVELRDPLTVLEEHYHLPVSSYKYFTFSRIE